MHRTVLLVSAATLAFAQPALAETKTYIMDSFNALDVSAGIEIIFEAGEDQSIIAENQNGNFDKLVIQTKCETLVVRSKSSGWFNRKKREDYSLRISAPLLASIEASSGSDITAKGLVGEAVRLDASSGARIEAIDIDSGNISLDARSGATLEAYGTCRSADLSTSSGANIEADKLVCTNVSASASSGSSLNAHATLKADASASSGASIRVVGGATLVNSKKSSGGSVRIS